MGRHIKDEIKEIIIKSHLKGKSYKTIADDLHMSESSVGKIVRRYKERGTIDNIKQSGRPRKTTPRDDRKIIIEAKKNPFATGR